jgi:hypothetical protein
MQNVPAETFAKFGRAANVVKFLKSTDPEEVCKTLIAAHTLIEDRGGLQQGYHTSFTTDCQTRTCDLMVERQPIAKSCPARVCNLDAVALGLQQAIDFVQNGGTRDGGLSSTRRTQSTLSSQEPQCDGF